MRDIVGLYMNPPEKAMVLCVDEKSEVQALDRTAPLLPMRPGQIERRTHDYRRNGATSLFAALDTATGKLIGSCRARRRSIEFVKFLKQVDAAVPQDLDIHMVLDNYGTHKTPRVRRWLARRPRYRLHFIPTGSSWLNLIERWFAELTNKAIRRGSFAGVGELITAIHAFLDASNQDPTVYVWTASAEAILDKVARCKAILQTEH